MSSRRLDLPETLLCVRITFAWLLAYRKSKQEACRLLFSSQLTLCKPSFYIMIIQLINLKFPGILTWETIVDWLGQSASARISKICVSAEKVTDEVSISLVAVAIRRFLVSYLTKATRNSFSWYIIHVFIGATSRIRKYTPALQYLVLCSVANVITTWVTS
jgi:hypothetical protein